MKEPQMPETTRLDEWTEWLQSNSARVDLASGVAAGAGLSMMALVLLNVSVLRRVNPMDFIDVVRVVLMATISYLIAALIIHLLWIKPLRRVIPSWLMIACLGSLLIVVSAGAWSFYTKAAASSAPASMLPTLPGFIGNRVKDGLAVVVVLSLLTLPTTATVYYAESVVRMLRRWQTGPELPSILGNNEPGKPGL
jgi:hypothetical protein